MVVACGCVTTVHGKLMFHPINLRIITKKKGIKNPKYMIKFRFIENNFVSCMIVSNDAPENKVRGHKYFQEDINKTLISIERHTLTL